MNGIAKIDLMTSQKILHRRSSDLGFGQCSESKSQSINHSVAVTCESLDLG